MPRHLARAAVAAVAVLACAACSEDSTRPSDSASDSGSEPTPASTPTKSSVAPADGPRLEGDGYAYHVPKGWGLSSQELPGFDPDTFALDLDDKDGFTDNVNVLLGPAYTTTPEEAEVGAKNELTSAGATDVTVADRVEVSGVEAAHLIAGMSVNDNDYTIEQFYAASNDQTFVVTFSFSNSVSSSDRTEVTDAVLASWSWTD